MTRDGALREDLPPITTFLNRVLALEISLQNVLFAHFEGLLAAQIEGAIAAGTYDVGLETIRAASLAVTDRQTVATHASGAQTQLFTVAARERTNPLSLDNVLSQVASNTVLLANARSGRAALQEPSPSWTLAWGGRSFRRYRPADPNRIWRHNSI